MTLSGELDRERRRAEQGGGGWLLRWPRRELSVAIGELDDAEYSAVTDFGLDLDRVRELRGHWKDANA